MAVNHIEGIPTDIVGFVGKGFNLKTFSNKTEEKLLTSDIFKNNESDIKTLKNGISISKTDDEIIILESVLSSLRQKIDDLSDLDEKIKVLKYFSKVEEKVQKLRRLFDISNKAIFVSSWSDYKNKFGINSFSGNVSEEGYLAPAVYSFFENGGSRCYVVSTMDLDASSIIGFDTNGVRSGLSCFEEIDDISIICAPGITDKSVQLKIINHCENQKDRFAIFDSAKSDTLDGIQIRKESLSSDKGLGALYYPWIEVSIETEDDDNKLILNNIFVPPSGAVAGIYARSDNERGVHKAPANEVVKGALSLEKNITTAEQDILNPKNINCIRAFKGRGIRVWGARTISSDPLWKYVNVRRLFLYLEGSIEKSMQWVVFEANNEQLWVKVTHIINNFLLGVWKSGALMGASPDEAFFVKCDKTTMTVDDIVNGRLVITIGVASIKPAEFIIFKIIKMTAN